MFEGLADPVGHRFLPGEPPASVAALRVIYERQVVGRSPDGAETWLNWIVRRRAGGTPVGTTQATIRERIAQVAYHVFPVHWREGFGTAAVKATLDELFETSSADEVRALVDTRNAASIALLRTLGFEHLRTIIGADHFKGSPSDENEYAMSRARWTGRAGPVDRSASSGRAAPRQVRTVISGNRETVAGISDELRETVRLAVKGAFGLAPVGTITPVLAGLSGVPFRVEVGGRCYLVRVEGPASPLRNRHQYSSMLIASEAGIAPRVHFVDPIARVAVMDFIEERPLGAYPGGPAALSQALGSMLRRVQATALFPAFADYVDLVARLWTHVSGTDLLDAGVLEACAEHLLRVRRLYEAEDKALVSSHGDPVPRNVLFDGNRLWLIDWESANCNDPLVDAAIMLDSFALSGFESVLLRAWLGHQPGEVLYARLALIRALTRLYYACVLLSASATADGPAERLRVGGEMYLDAFLTGSAPTGLDAPFDGLKPKSP